MEKKNQIIIFRDETLEIEVSFDKDNYTVWLSQAQMATLFNVDRSRITRHINNIYQDNELDKSSTSAESAQVRIEGTRKVKRKIEIYNLDMIISVGYRVNSKQGIIFRKWATNILREYMVRGYVENEKRLLELNKIIKISKRSTNDLESKAILDVLERYSRALNLLDGYDNQSIAKPKGSYDAYYISYDEAIAFLKQMEFKNHTSLFGKEKDGGFKSGLAAIYQTFDGKELIPTIEEKAASLLYSLVKNHGFIDGNKRIAAAMFIYFLDKNNILKRNDKLVIDNSTLVTLTILIAESKPQEKEIIINLIMNFLVK